MYRLNRDQTLIELLVKLRDFNHEYPPNLLYARRVSFIRLISRYVMAWVRV
ncbi:MAG TPA: hypothetical protein VK249_17315 [Anaerolineales bacterium]|nr:hypothetical protein [Anaerolineales bacterium]